ncbi:MAG: helix-turn-helix domain-containing protein [Actinomycetota bacterium]|nr:helix-turn-helix domain-containing protein [Actinomycetota bacterium]MDP2288740.1 helix-turn-helix domain-containing protein [Actinomycetota bacterium]
MTVTAQAPVSRRADAHLRRDAELNRRKILDAAREVFAERGVEAPLDEVARHAEVGIATLYRRFPTRDDLIVAAFQEKMEAWADAVEHALTEPDPCVAFPTYIRLICDMQAADRGFTDVLTMRFPMAPDIEAARDRGTAGFMELMQRTQAAGGLRSDFAAEDFIFLLMANAGVINAAGTAAPAARRRLISYLLQAFGAEDIGTLPPSPGQDATLEAMQRMPHAKRAEH